MNPLDIFEGLKCGDLQLNGHIVERNRIPVAILQPSLLIGTQDTGTEERIAISGPLGNVVLGHCSLDNWISLAACGALVPGCPDSVKAISTLINDPASSRTTSYILTGSRTCEEALRRYDTIRRAKVAVVGCGGIGSLAAILLAGAGVKQLRLVDKDIVELSNLNRQLFYTREDIGKLKVNVLAAAIRARFEGLNVEQCPEDVQIQNLEMILQDCTAAILTVDEPLGIAAQIRHWASRRIILVTALYTNQNAVVSLANEVRPSDSRGKWIRWPSMIPPSFGPLNAELGGLSSSVLIHALTGDLGPVYETGWSIFGFPREYEDARS